MKNSFYAHITYILLTLLIAIGSTTFLYFFSHKWQQTPKSFIRLFPPHLTTPDTIIDLRYNSYYPVGTSNASLYLGNTTDPTHLWQYDTTTARLQKRNVILPSIPLYIGKARYHIVRDSLFLTEGQTPIIYAGTVKERRLQIVDSSTFFLQAQPLSSNQIALKIYNGTTSLLSIKNLTTHQLKVLPNLLTQQIDGLFDMDGQLHPIPLKHQLLYLYRYRNTFIVSDTTGQYAHYFHTLDTISKAQIQLSKLPNGLTKFAAPPLIVNKNSTVTDSLLFVHSGLKASNETHMSHTKLNVIDIYQLSDGSYRYSFYIPNYLGHPLQHMYIYGNTLYAFQGSALIKFNLHLPH